MKNIVIAITVGYCVTIGAYDLSGILGATHQLLAAELAASTFLCIVLLGGATTYAQFVEFAASFAISAMSAFAVLAMQGTLNFIRLACMLIASVFAVASICLTVRWYGLKWRWVTTAYLLQLFILLSTLVLNEQGAWQIGHLILFLGFGMHLGLSQAKARVNPLARISPKATFFR